MIDSAENAAPVNKNWLAAGLVVTVVGLLATGIAAGRAIVDLAPLTTEQQSQTYHRDINRLEIRLPAGDLTVSQGPAGQVLVDQRLRWHHTRPTVTQEWSEHTLRVTAVCPEEDNCTVDYAVRAPAGAAVVAYTAAGRLSIRDIGGELDVGSESGDIEVSNASGRVRIRGDAGNITASALRAADVDVQTGSGDVTLSFASAPTTATATVDAGAITIAVPRTGGPTDGYHVQATTNDGQRHVLVHDVTDGPHRIVASIGVGDVTVTYA